FTGFSNATLASVGDELIERDEYRLRLQQQIQQVSQQIGEPLSVSQARSLGIDRRVLTDMLGMAALSGMAKNMGLAHSDEQVARQIINDPAFYGPTGKFDAPTFRAILRQNGLTEKMFVKDQREFHLRQQLMDSSVRQSLVPDALLSQMYRHVLEKRVARYLIVSLDATDEVGEPTEGELESFFSETKLRFTEPERRDGSVLLITPERFAETIKISDDEILAEYDLSIDEFSSPERRAIDQLVLNSDEEIEKINSMLDDNRPFAEIVDAASQTLDDTDLGLITRDGLISSTLAERAFSMQADEISDIIEGPLGAVILRVRKIEEGTVRPYEEVRAILRDRLAYDRAVNEMIEFSETVEDERAAGIELEEIGQRFDLEVVK
ncbi:MAG: SurA N-terminal domain-containing protein, partial [Pseudomonadota bacterium]|nr:SurA N-terminal domain-containing protein [Pseudomonadota bacterium]